MVCLNWAPREGPYRRRRVDLYFFQFTFAFHAILSTSIFSPNFCRFHSIQSKRQGSNVTVFSRFGRIRIYGSFFDRVYGRIPYIRPYTIYSVVYRIFSSISYIQPYTILLTCLNALLTCFNLTILYQFSHV